MEQGSIDELHSTLDTLRVSEVIGTVDLCV